MAAAVNVAASPASYSPANRSSTPASTKAESEFGIAVHAVEAPLSVRLGSDSPATTASSAFGYQQKQLWSGERRHVSRPAYASEGTDLSTLTVTDSRPDQPQPRDEVDEDRQFSASASADSESTLSADSPPSSCGDGADPDAIGWDGVIGVGGPSGVAERHHLIETDRTSLSSSDDWADCEYELIAAQRVSELFEQIDSLLFSQEPTVSTAAQPTVAKTLEECSEWRAAFPHLRLRGCQIAPPKELGFSHRAAPSSNSDDSTPRPAEEQLADQLDSGLQVVGRALDIRRSSADGIDPSSSEAADFEELLAQEGFVEEAIAIDNDAPTDEPQRPAPRRSRSVAAQQPVTPSLALRDASQCASFDSLWARLVGWSMPLFLELLRRTRRFVQQQQRSEDDREADAGDDDDTVDDFDDEPAGPLHRGPYPAGSHSHHRHGRFAAAANANSAAVATADPRLAGDLAGLLSISSKTLQQRSEPAFQPAGLAAAAPTATASVAGFGRRPLGRLAPVDRPKTPQQHRFTTGGGQQLQQPQLHHQQPQLPLQPQHHPQHAGLFAAFTRSGTLPPLHDRRGPQLLQQASQPHHPSLRAGGAASVRPGSGGRPGAYSSLDWPTPTPGGHFGGGRPGGQRANSGLHHRHRGLDVHGRALAAVPTELDALYEAAPAMRASNSLHLGPASSSYQQMRRSKPVGLIRR